MGQSARQSDAAPVPAAVSRLSRAGARFTVGRDAAGRWIVSDRDGLVGGIFRDRASAVHFAVFESDHRPGAVRCVPDPVVQIAEACPAVSWPRAASLRAGRWAVGEKLDAARRHLHPRAAWRRNDPVRHLPNVLAGFGAIGFALLLIACGITLASLA